MLKKIMLISCLTLACAASLPAKPASNARVGGGMLMGIGVPIAIIGLAGIGSAPGSWGLDFRAVGTGMAVGGIAATGLGAWLWVKGGARQEVALSLRF